MGNLTKKQKKEIEKLLQKKQSRAFLNRTWELVGWPADDTTDYNYSISLTAEQAKAILKILNIEVE